MTAPTAPRPRHPDAPAQRRMWWGELPVLHCLRCHERDVAGKLDDPTLVVHNGALRCRVCHTVHYGLFLTPLGVAFVVETTSAEVRDINARQLSTIEVLHYFGFPTLSRTRRPK